MAESKTSKDEKKGHLLGVWGFILGIIALVLCWIPIVGIILAICGVVLCGIGLSKTKSNKGLVIAGLVMSILALIVGIIITLISLVFVSVASNLSNLNNSTFTQNNSLTISNASLITGPYGMLEITGIAKNTGSKELSYAEVDGKFYDKDGNVLQTSLDTTSNLNPGETWKFSISYPATDNYDVANFSVSAGSTW